MFYLFLLAHLVADFLLQPIWLVRRKRRWDGLFIHVGIVLACMLPIALLVPAPPMIWPAIVLISAVHLAADRWKICYGDRLFAGPLTPFMLDQALHVVTLAMVLSVCLPAELTWSLIGVPFVSEAIIAAGYLVAAVAAPIGLIVAFDPTFRYAALAGQARLRALICCTATVTLALCGGAAVAPAALFGLAFVLRRPLSEHPLDTPLGLTIVLAIAAGLGWGLGMLFT